MDVSCDAPSSARRRRERLRQFLRHERLSVAMALAEALQHSSGLLKKVVERREGLEGEVREEYFTPRGQTRPVVAEPHGRLEAAAGVSAGVPALVPVALSSADDGVGAAALSFLVSKALEVEEEQAEAEKKRQAQERRRRHRRREMVEELYTLRNLTTARRTPSVDRRIVELVAAIDSGDSSAPPRKRKKRRRRRTRRTRWSTAASRSSVCPGLALASRRT